MKLNAVMLEDSIYTVYDAFDESVKMKKAAAVYVTLTNKSVSVRLPKAEECPGQIAFVFVKASQATVAGYTANVETASGDYIYAAVVQVSEIVLESTEWVALVSDGLYWYRSGYNYA